MVGKVGIKPTTSQRIKAESSVIEVFPYIVIQNNQMNDSHILYHLITRFENFFSFSTRVLLIISSVSLLSTPDNYF